MTQPTVVIVGAALAGATAAGALRDEGFAGPIRLVGAETDPPYNRPPLSKGYLRGQEPFEAAAVHPVGYFAERDITLTLGATVTAIDPGRKRVELSGGASLEYDRLLVATGCRNRRIETPGADLDGIFQLRTRADCDRIRAVARRGRRAVLVGLGFIGCEVAASLRLLGVEVVAVDVHRVPLARVLGEEVGHALASIHRRRGVELVMEDTPVAFEGKTRVERVRTKAGRILECDFVVAGIGVVPNAELVAAAGGQVDNGVLVDAWCRTSLPDVWAAGDVANHQHPIFGRARVEHWNNALHHGRAAALAMLGRGAPYDYVHSFWSDQYEHVVEYVGLAPTWDRLVFRGRVGEKLLGFYLKGERIRAAIGLDRGGDPEDPKSDGELKAVARLIREGKRVDPAALADEGVALRGLVGAE